MPATRLSDLSEADLLARLFPVYAGAKGGDADVVIGPGDDAAVLAAPGGSVVLTTDTMVRGRDWRDDWSSPHEVGHKAVVQNVADIAAMGATPTGLLVALAADPATEVDWALGLAEGIAAAAREASAPVLGGDLSSAGPGTVMVAITAVGDLGGRAAVRRDGARPGDVVAVCGTLGRSGGGLQLLLADRGLPHDAPDPTPADRVVHDLCLAHRTAGRPPWEQGPVAADAGATSMIDLSDGLVRDLGRIARASGVGVELDGEALREHAAGPLTEALGADEAMRQVLSGGEEHSLVATFAPGEVPAGWHLLGRCTAGAPAVLVDGAVPEVTGWDHFRG
ncbi:thiamine-phosphate kinase [Janibacter indicus]|mgnify:FL=1|uniref:Thiamine-monophosphate kinase n=1 Tax=Janibacter indicus TaxID=857417 RepID=A0A1W1Y8K0_9MICO|nr:thiamine-phosphate kinase [Janibacter indicus]SMC32487.1 thiamine-phosphate kinase [Janibacter indicus]